MRAPKDERSLLHQWGVASPLVTVICPTYQHGEFIRSALEGIFGQQTSFRFHVILRDDSSTDLTREIVDSFASRFPSMFTVIKEPIRTYPNQKAWAELYPSIDTEFVALCDGDDYWISPLKLETQVRSLKESPWATYCHHQALVVDRQGSIVSDTALPRKYQRNTYKQLDIGDGFGITSTILHRNVPIDYRAFAPFIVNEDELIRGELLSCGGALFLPESTFAAYRVHSGGVWSGRGETERYLAQVSSFFWIGKYFSDQGRKRPARRYMAFAIKNLARAGIKDGFGGVLALSVAVFTTHPRTVVSKLLKKLRDLAE